jgi:hypothetical protein
MRDPLVDPEPGDVVRATDKTTGIVCVLVVVMIDDDGVSFTSSRIGARDAHGFTESLEGWRDWSGWADVAVLS